MDETPTSWQPHVLRMSLSAWTFPKKTPVSVYIFDGLPARAPQPEAIVDIQREKHILLKILTRMQEFHSVPGYWRQRGCQCASVLFMCLMSEVGVLRVWAA